MERAPRHTRKGDRIAKSGYLVLLLPLALQPLLLSLLALRRFRHAVRGHQNVPCRTELAMVPGLRTCAVCHWGSSSTPRLRLVLLIVVIVVVAALFRLSCAPFSHERAAADIDLKRRWRQRRMHCRHRPRKRARTWHSALRHDLSGRTRRRRRRWRRHHLVRSVALRCDGNDRIAVTDIVLHALRCEQCAVPSPTGEHVVTCRSSRRAYRVHGG